MYSPCDDCTLLQPDSSIRTSAGKGYLLLTAAYRSLSRPSSAPSAKASALCSSWLDQSSAWRSVTSGLLLKLIHSSENFWFSRCKLISKCSFLPSISFKRLCLSNSISFSLLTCLYTIWYYIQFSRYNSLLPRISFWFCLYFHISPIRWRKVHGGPGWTRTTGLTLIRRAL